MAVLAVIVVMVAPGIRVVGARCHISLFYLLLRQHNPADMSILLYQLKDV